MRRIISFFLLLLSLHAFAQTVSLDVSKDLEWAKWFYETLEFRDDCTILKGYFIPSDNGCWVISKMNETLKAGGKEYHIIYTTLPINRHPRTTYPGGVKVYFEEHFEPIFSTGGLVHHTNHNISFPIPFNKRERTKPLEKLLPAYEQHIDSLISQEKYSIAAYLLNKFAKDVCFSCSPKSKKEISRRIFSKYKVQNFFINASSDYEDIYANFAYAHSMLNYEGDGKILNQLEEMSKLLGNIVLNMNGSNHSKVIEWCELLIPMVQKFGKYNKCYDNALSLYRKALILDGQTQRIPGLDKEIVDVCSHIYNVKEAHYIEHLMNIASDLDIRPSKTSYDTHVCINIWKEVRDRAMQNYPSSWRYASALLEIANYNCHYRFFDVALMQYLTIDSLYKVKRNEWISEVWYNHDILTFEQAKTYVNLMHRSLVRAIGYCYFKKDDLASAVKYDAMNPYYHYALGNFNTLFLWCKDSYEKSIKGLKDIIKKPTIIKPGAYYEEVFDMAYAPTLTTHIPYFAYKTNSKELCEKAYDGAIVTKEFRLTAGNRLRELLRSTQDSVTIEFTKNIDCEMRTYQSMMNAHDLHSQDKYWEIVQLQRDIVAHLDSINALDTYFPNWTEIRNVLKENELAIEFIEFPLWNQKQSMYAALTLRKESEHPKITSLFEGMLLKQVSDTLFYQCKDMTDLVWKPLESELRGVKNIYFSPSGALYNIGIEYLPGMENYNIYRLSSTRELVTRKNFEPENHAVLYGGLDYNAETDTTNTAKSLTALNETFKEHADVRSMGLRGGKEYLEHTKIEVDKIGEELTNAKWLCLLDTAKLGTEESFKALSGKRIGCLHISTHGFYYTKEEADNAKYDFMQMGNTIVTDEDKALTRSGLLMSGANHILDGDTLPANVEDGILTAKEIADIDLRGLDLVVLSACQTGLGDISQGEGVFGLQRGFKKAGANTILMSLWEVNDEATQILMTQFYKNLVSGLTKRQSLLNAQKNLRGFNNGQYDEPKYWAAFIMLDALM